MSQAKLARKRLADPAHSLIQYGKIVSQEDGQEHDFDPYAITNNLQATIISYVSDPPKTVHGQVAWLCLLGYRQGGKSTCGELAFYPKVAFTPNWDHACIADTRARVDYLHKRVHLTHELWPEAVRSPKVKRKEVRQFTFDPVAGIGGSMRGLSGEAGAVGIGQSPDSLHLSEAPFWRDYGGSMNLIIPSMINRNHSYLLSEATPAPADAPSAEAWMEQCQDAAHGIGRWVYAFFPYWDGKLNQRPWLSDWVLSNEELALMEEFGPQGLTKENLSFRRFMLDTDRKMRRNPELFDVFYPKDDVSCWGASTRSVIGAHILDKHAKGLIQWKPVDGYQEYEPPQEDAIYCIGVDPAGFAARDHAAFQVLKIYSDEWSQVATFAAHVGPEELVDQIEIISGRYNNARIGVEENGVGTAVLALLRQRGLDTRLHYRKRMRPGIWSSAQSNDQHLGWLVDALLSELRLKDADTVRQLKTYGHDKRVERSATAEILQGDGQGSRRRDRHHWDKVSALMFAIVVARTMPRRSRPETQEDSNILLFKDMSWNKVQEYKKQVQHDADRSKKARRRYVSVRKRRRR